MPEPLDIWTGPPAKVWSMDDASDCSPMQLLIGHATGQWVADDEALKEAICGVLAVSFLRAGLDFDDALDAAVRHVDRDVEVTVAFDGKSLRIQFDEEGDPAWPVDAS